MPSNIAPASSCQKISISSSAAQSSVINASVVHVTPTVACFVRHGVDPTAVSTGVDHYLVGNATQEFFVIPGEKLSFITDGASGTVYVAVVG